MKIKTFQGAPFALFADAKQGKIYPTKDKNDDGVSAVKNVIVLRATILPNAKLYGFAGQTPNRDWVVLNFIDSQNRLCETVFHSSSAGGYVDFLRKAIYDGLDPLSIKVDISYPQVSKKTNKGSYFCLTFDYGDTVTQAERDSLTEFLSENPTATTPTRHIYELCRHAGTAAELVRVIKACNLTTAELTAIEVADQQTGEVRSLFDIVNGK